MNQKDLLRPVADAAALSAPLASFNTADAVEFLNTLELSRAADTLAALPLPRAVKMLEQPELNRSGDLVALLPVARAAALLGLMADDRATDIVHELDEDERARLIPLLSADARQSIQQLLSYPAYTAGALMTTEFVSVPADWTVGRTLQHIREVERTRETVYAIYVLDPASERLLHVVTMRRLITGLPDASILDVAQVNAPVTVDVAMDQEEVAQLIRRHDLLAIPVVDAGMLLHACSDAWKALFDGDLKGKRVTRVVGTHLHPDPIGLAGWLCKRFDCDVWMTRGEWLTARMLIAELAKLRVRIDLDYVSRHFLGRSYPTVMATIRREFGLDLPEDFEAKEPGRGRLAQRPEQSRARIQKFIDAGCVRVNVQGNPEAWANSMAEQMGAVVPVRVATYTHSLYDDEEGGLIRRLESGDANARNIAAVAARTGCVELHASAKAVQRSAMRHHNPALVGLSPDWTVTDAEEVTALRAALDRI